MHEGYPTKPFVISLFQILILVLFYIYLICNINLNLWVLGRRIWISPRIKKIYMGGGTLRCAIANTNTILYIIQKHSLMIYNIYKKETL